MNDAVLVTTTYLEQNAPADLRPSPAPPEPGRIEMLTEPDPAFNSKMYATVGGPWQWTVREAWTLQDWGRWLRQPGRETWVLWLEGQAAGYAELDAEDAGHHTDVEIAYFGLAPGHTGRGWGAHLLTAVTEHAWNIGARWPDLSPVTRVWVHTCTLDGPHALANYRARGFVAYRTTEEERADGEGSGNAGGG
ncbi:MAG: GNAT family N-acetyltransferase [Actinomycetota bacterium]|nr:GNAT family N-acetyltransferase [Actinomycetota bacterium]